MKRFVAFLCFSLCLAASAAESLTVSRNANGEIEAAAAFSDEQSAALQAAVGSATWKVSSGSASIVCGRICVASGTIQEVRDGSAGWAFSAPAGTSYYDLFQIQKDDSIDPGYSGETKTLASSSGKIRLTAWERGGQLTLSLKLDEKLALGGRLTVYPASMGKGLLAVLPVADSQKLRAMLPEVSGPGDYRASSGIGAIQMKCQTGYCEVALYEHAQPIPGISYSTQGTTLSVSVDGTKLPGKSLYSQLDTRSTICRGGPCKQFWSTGGAVSITAMANGTDYLSIRK